MRVFPSLTPLIQSLAFNQKHPNYQRSAARQKISRAGGCADIPFGRPILSTLGCRRGRGRDKVQATELPTSRPLRPGISRHPLATGRTYRHGIKLLICCAARVALCSQDGTPAQPSSQDGAGVQPLRSFPSSPATGEELLPMMCTGRSTEVIIKGAKNDVKVGRDLVKSHPGRSRLSTSGEGYCCDSSRLRTHPHTNRQGDTKFLVPTRHW